MKRMLKTYGAGLAASTVVLSCMAFLMAIFAEPALSQQPPLAVRSGPASSDLAVDIGGSISGLVTFTTSASTTLTLPAYTSSTETIVTIFVAPDRVNDLLEAIAGRGTVVSVHQPDNYCRPQRDAPAVAQPAPPASENRVVMYNRAVGAASSIDWSPPGPMVSIVARD